MCHNHKVESMDSQKIILFPISIEELRNLISEAVKKELDRLPTNNSPPLEPELISRREAAKLLRISLPTLSDYIMRSILPAYRIGNNVRLRKDEVLKALEKIQTIKYKSTN